MNARDTAPQPGASSSKDSRARETAAGPVSPWTDQRARVGKLTTLVRVIDLEADRQEFVVLQPTIPDDLADLAFDGETVILPKATRTAAELAEILARFDERYWTTDHNNQTRISALRRERYLKP
jgi:hypothetical protein